MSGSGASQAAIKTEKKKCVSTDPLKIGAASALLVGGAMLIQGDGAKGALKSAGIQLVASGVTHLVGGYMEDEPAARAAAVAKKEWVWDSRSWSGLAVEAVVVGGLFTAAERWGRGSCCPGKDFLTSAIADFAASSAITMTGLSDYKSEVCYTTPA